MKRHRGLFEQMVSLENITAAHEAAKKGKRHYAEVRRVDANPKYFLNKIRRLLVSGKYRTSKYTCMVKQGRNKLRVIHKLPYYPDRIVHHCVVQVVFPIWTKNLIRDTYACVPGRGIHDGLRRIQSAMQDEAGTRYCLKMDVRQFYPSIDHDILKEIIRRKIKDRRLIMVIDELIDSSDAGVPIGNYLSQHFGNLYLSGYDHWMKEHHRCRYYYRYCDDVVVLGATKERLHDLRNSTAEYWKARLALDLKGNWQVFPVDARGVDFLGYRFFHGYTLLRKSIATRYKRKMSAIKKGRPMSGASVVSGVASYEGWMVHANCHNLKRGHHDTAVSARLAQAAVLSKGAVQPIMAAGAIR